MKGGAEKLAVRSPVSCRAPSEAVRRTLAWCAASAALAITHSAFAQPPVIPLDARLSAAQVRVGDQVTVLVTIAGLDSRLGFRPRVGPELGVFRVVAVRPPAPSVAGTAPATTWAFVITSFDEGPAVVPSIRFDGLNAEGRPVQVAETTPISIDVLAPEVDPRSPLKPLKPPMAKSLPGLYLSIAGAAVLVAVGIASLAALVWRRIRSRVRAPRLAPAESPARLLAQLESLRGLDARTIQEKREVLSRLFHGVRAIARHWFGVPAEGLSSPELARAAAGKGCGRPALVEFGDALASIDHARFAQDALERADTAAVVSRTLSAVKSIRSAVRSGGSEAGSR